MSQGKGTADTPPPGGRALDMVPAPLLWPQPPATWGHVTRTRKNRCHDCVSQRHAPAMWLQNPEIPCFYKGPLHCPCLHIAPKATVHCPASFRGMRAIDSTSGSFQRGCCRYRRPSILSLLTEFSRPLLLRHTLVWMYRSDTRAVSVACGPLSPSPRPLPHTADSHGREDGPPLPTRVEVGSGQARHCAD